MILSFAAAAPAPWMAATITFADAEIAEDWEELSEAEKVEDNGALV